MLPTLPVLLIVYVIQLLAFDTLHYISSLNLSWQLVNSADLIWTLLVLCHFAHSPLCSVLPFLHFGGLFTFHGPINAVHVVSVKTRLMGAHACPYVLVCPV